MKDTQKTIMLTGASRGIGHATVKRFSEAGWRVITCSRHAVPGGCPWDAGRQDHLEINLESPEEITRAAEKLLAKLDGAPLHALVNNAGMSPKGGNAERLNSLNTSLDVWQEVFQVNVFAPVMLAKALIDPLQRGPGTVVNITSIAGSRVHEFAGTAYAASKAALSALTREMASDFGKLGVRVNAIAPGEILTEILSPGTEEIMLPAIPLGRLGTSEEVAETIFFLCDKSAAYINGAELHVNGGQHV